MKKGLIILISMLISCNLLTAQDQSKEAKPKKVTEWDKTNHDFGEILLGKPMTAEFTFTNTGDTPVNISKVRSSCGCTVTKYTKEPVLPGETGFVKATYNAAKLGNFTKSVTVSFTNSKFMDQLWIRGKVIKKTVEQ